MTPQGGDGIRGPGTCSPGGVIDVEIGPNENTVQVNYDNHTSSYRVSPGKTASVPVPPVPPGTVIAITIGQGLRQRLLLVEVVAPGP